MAHDPYLDSASGVLRNKLGLTSQDGLEKYETFVTAERIKQLEEKPVPGDLDQKHLQKIHEYIFQDVYHRTGEHKYPIAGAVRVIGIQKEDDPDYPHPDHYHPDGNLHKRLEKAFDNLAKDKHLVNVSTTAAFVTKLTKHIGEIWACHPFREGNTRAVAMFTRHLTRNAGRDFDHKAISGDPGAFRHALKAYCLYNDPRALKTIFNRFLAPVRTADQKQRSALYQEYKAAKNQIIDTTERKLETLKAPFLEERKTLEEAVKQIKLDIREHAKKSPRVIGKKKHDAETDRLIQQLAAAVRRIGEFKKTSRTATATLKKGAMQYAKEQHPEASEVVKKWESVEKQQRASRVRTKSTTRTI